MKLKSILFLLLLMMFVDFDLSARAHISLHQVGQMPTHGNIPMPADQPDVYYNNVLKVIIIDGMGEVNYYDVEIFSVTTSTTVISTQVNGYYDTIDISSLPEAEYGIIIYSPTGNIFEGFFEIY